MHIVRLPILDRCRLRLRSDDSIYIKMYNEKSLMLAV